MSDTAKNIYNRLYRSGVNVKLNQIKAKMAEVSSDGNLSKEQIDAIVEALKAESEGSKTQDVIIPPIEASQDLNSEPKMNIESSLSIPSTPVTNQSALTQRQAISLVSEKILELDLELATSDMKLIANSIFERNLSEQEAIEYLGQVISQVLAKQESEYTTNLKQVVSAIVHDVNSSYERRNALLTETLGSLKVELEETTTAYKSRVSGFKGSIREAFQA